MTSNPSGAPSGLAESDATENSSLRHVMLVGGTLAEWAQLDRARWDELIDELGQYCSGAGVPWLTIRAYATGDEGQRAALTRRHMAVGRCEVIVDPCGDGRQRFADAMASLDPADEVNEVTVAATLYEPADSEPDLVVVLGDPVQLPPSLVWELAYAELAFSPVEWSELSAVVLQTAFDEFSVRRRRFGGLDDE